MTNTITNIKGTGIICKGNVKGNFELVPMELFDYVQLNLISHTDLIVYVKLLQLYNHKEGYAYPTIPMLMNYTHIRSKATIHNALNTLEKVGLIQKSKTNKGNNVYIVFKPLSKNELYSLFPDKVEQFKKFETKLMITAEHDKERLQHHQQNRQEQQQQEQPITARQVIPNVEHPVNEEFNNDLLPEEIELIRKTELLEKSKVTRMSINKFSK